MTKQWQLAVILCVVSCHGQVAKYTDGSMVFDIVWAGDEVSPPKVYIKSRAQYSSIMTRPSTVDARSSCASSD